MFRKTIFTLFIMLQVVSLPAKKYSTADTKNDKTKIPETIKPAFDYWMRDTWVAISPDGCYYMTGTTSDPNRQYLGQIHCWDWNDGIYLWKSKDLKNWESCGLIWSVEKDGTW